MTGHETERIFVYGTLRRGGSNHHRLEGAAFISTARVRGRLYRIDWYPGLVLDDSAGPVLGEVYEVSNGILDDLDAFEGDAYLRVNIEVRLSDSTSAEAWLWEWNRSTDEYRRITGGDWLASG